MSFFFRPIGFTLFLLTILVSGGLGLYSYVTAAHYTPLAWSPDGQSLVCNYKTAANNGTVVLLPRQGGREVILHTNKGARGCYKASFSPDGRRVAFEHMGIYVVGIDGKNEREVADGELKGWASESSIVVQEDTSKCFEVNIDTGARRPIPGKQTALKPMEHRLFHPGHSKRRLPNGDVIEIELARHPAIYRTSASTGQSTFLAYGDSHLISPQRDCLAYSENGTIRFLSL